VTRSFVIHAGSPMVRYMPAVSCRIEVRGYSTTIGVPEAIRTGTASDSN
jgi:hypothetical protein